MSKPTMESLVQPPERVERENRRLKRAGALTLALIAAVALMGWHPDTAEEVHEVVLAKQFVVRDKSGNHRGMLGVGPDGLARLTI